MAFYKYGLAFLAGTGFGATMTTLRNSRCSLHKHDSCSFHRRHRPFGGSGESPAAETGREREEYYDALDKRKKRCPKKGGKENKGDKSEELSD